MLKIAIIGCGKIADSHAEQISALRDCRLVAACDRELLMARQLAERFDVPETFDDVSKLLKTVRPDVVHITTPPHSHLPLAKQSLEAGSHVYVEKPFTLDVAEAEELIACAMAADRKVTVGHDLQFSHAARRMRKLVHEGYLGGEPVHLESYYCYELSNPTYARAFLANNQHWVRHLPGKLLHNIISHGIARIAEFLRTDIPRVQVHGFVSPLLRSLGEREIIDELRVVISEEDRLTAYFTFSSQMRPALNGFRLYGPRNGLLVDQEQETVIKLRGERYKSYLEKFYPQWQLAKQYASNSMRNIGLFLRRDFHMKAGMRHLIESFYDSIRNQGAPPIAYREILLTTRIMDSIFAQLAEAGVKGAGFGVNYPATEKASATRELAGTNG